MQPTLLVLHYEPKVAKLEDVTGSEEHVGWLDVPMDQPERVDVAKRPASLSKPGTDECFVKLRFAFTLSCDPLRQISACRVLCVGGADERGVELVVLRTRRECGSGNGLK